MASTIDEYKQLVEQQRQLIEQLMAERKHPQTLPVPYPAWDPYRNGWQPAPPWTMPTIIC